MNIPQRVIDRVLSRVRDTADGCVETNYSTGSHGYGQIGWHDEDRRRMALTHRVAWIAKNGPIPEGMTVDHICRNRKCLNVEHLRLLTNSENASDNGFRSRTHCPAGHPYAGPNLYIDPTGGRRCRTCAKAHAARRNVA